MEYGMEQYRKIADMIKEQKYVVAFTGAGISVDAGIPAFRGGQGLWEKYDPMEYAQISTFMRHPEKVWIMLRDMASVVFASMPSPAHKALAGLEKLGYLKAVITQNVDGLHQEAGNTNVIEYHGNHRWLVCMDCQKRLPFTPDAAAVHPYPRCEKCGKALKPDVVFFGEGIPMAEMVRANNEANQCKAMFIIGTSGVVYPAADIPYQAKSKGAVIIEINVEKTPFTSSITDHFLKGTASDILPHILEFL